MRLFVQGSRPRIGIIFLMGFTGLIIASIGLVLSFVYLQGSYIRETEKIIYTQGSTLVATYRTVFQMRTQNSTATGSYGTYLGSKFIEQPPSSLTRSKLPERKLSLNPFKRTIPTALEDPVRGKPADKLALEIASSLIPVLTDAEKATNSSIHLTDFNGVLTSSNNFGVGKTIVDQDGVMKALNGEHISFLRHAQKNTNRKTVFSALPIVLNNRLLGTVILTRIPPSPITELFKPDNKESYQYRYVTRFAKYILMTFIVIMLGTLIFSLSIVSPIRNLIRQTRRIAAGDQIKTDNLLIAHTRELDELSNSINEMAEKLQNNSKYIEGIAKFFSHEFKTPLTGIVTNIDVLSRRKQSMSPEKEERFLSNIKKGAEQLDDLVKYLTKLINVRGMKVDDHKNAKINDVLMSIRNQNIDQRVDVVTAEKNTTVQISSELLLSIISSLIDNAKRHRGEQSKVVISPVYPDNLDKRLQIRVSNEGDAIPDEEARRIFEPFFTTVRHGTQRSGLGLAYVKELLQVHGGDISLATDTGDVTFQLTIPIAT